MQKIKKIESGTVQIIYRDLGNRAGYYRIRPGKPPYICLNERFLHKSSTVQDGPEPAQDVCALMHVAVYSMLLSYHQAIPPNSVYRLFPMVRWFAELIPVSLEAFAQAVMTDQPQPQPQPDAPEAVAAPAKEIIFIGKARADRDNPGRDWSYLPDGIEARDFRVIG